MRTLLVLAALAGALAAPALPLADAAHMGPCWHEYAEAALYAATRPPKEALQIIGATVRGCLDNPVCDVIDPCVLP